MALPRHLIWPALLLFIAMTATCTPGPGGGGPGTSTSLPAGSSEVQVLLTTGDRSRLLSDEPDLPITQHQPGQLASITVDTAISYQQMEGVGAALTDSAAFLIDKHLSAPARDQLIHDLFGPAGAHLNYVRLPISSSDFSVDDYTYDDVPYPDTDLQLARFAIDRDLNYTIPILQRIRQVNPQMRLMGSAWSAPGWMKSGNNRLYRKGLIGGTLASEYVDVYARYLRRVVQEFAVHGLPFDALTMQNEPAYSPGDYAGMLLSPSQEADLAIATSMEFDSVGIDTDLLVHDHNWNLSSRAVSVLEGAASHIDGSAFHCYGGDPSAQSAVHAAFPEKDIYFTECTGTFSSGSFSSNLLWNTNNLLIGATRNWAKSVLLWNLALDERGGPNIGGCPDCRGVVTIDSTTGAVTRNEEYYALAHFGRGVRPGAVRVESTASVGAVRSVAFLNPDSSRALLLSNDSASATSVSVREGDQTFSYAMPPRSVATLTWG